MSVEASGYAHHGNAAERRDLRIVCGALAFALVCMFVLAALRGVWLDELWTLWLTGRDLPLGDAFFKRWSFEPHPPLFYFWMWSLRHVLPTIVPVLRCGNLIGLALLAVAARIARRHGADPRFLWLYVLLVASSPVIVVYFAELRSYFLQATLLAGLVLLLERVHFARHDLSRRETGLAGAILLWMLLAPNLHYLNAAVTLTMVGMEALNQFRRRRWRYTALLIGAMLAAMACLAVPLRHYLSLAPVASPMEVSNARGYLVMGFMIAVGIGANLAALVFALRGGWIARPLSSTRGTWGEASAFTYAVELALVIAVVAVAFTTLNLSKHFLVPRYVLQLVAIGAAPVAWWARGGFGTRWFWLVPANAVLLAGAAVAMQGPNKRWEYNIARIQAQIRACPATRVLALDSIALTDRSATPKAGDDPNATLAAIMANGYGYVAGRAGFHTDLVPRPGPLRAIESGCPTLLWLESNYYRSHLTAADLLQIAHIADDPATIASMRVEQASDHALLYIYPRQPGR